MELKTGIRRNQLKQLPYFKQVPLAKVEGGSLELEKDVNAYLKSWKLPENEFTETEKVTLGRIVSHTGGLTVHGFPGYSNFEEVAPITAVLNGTPPANTAAIRVDTKPGTNFRYSGGGYCIMQLLMEDVFQQSYPEITKATVLAPLDMTNSTYEQPMPDNWQPQAATGYLPDNSKVKGKWHIYPEMAAAGLWTTAEDLAKFVIDLQLSIKGEEGHILSPEMANKMTSPYFSDFIGLGIFLNDRDGQVYFSHGGWDEGFSSETVAHKTAGYGVVVLTNSNHPPFIDELIRSVRNAYQWENYTVPKYNPLPISQAELSRYSGKYAYDKDEVINIYEENGKLFLKYLKAKQPMELIKVDSNEFARRTRDNRIKFLNHPETDQLCVVFFENPDSKAEFDHPKIDTETKVPFELVCDNKMKEALAAYQVLDGEAREKEGSLNNLGYQLLQQDRIDLAIRVFLINTQLFPDSSNVYDSLGEAYLKNGEKDLAIKNYQKSLELNPNNANAKKVLGELEVDF